jgi:hypothetical protein
MKFWLKIEAILNKIIVSLSETMAKSISNATPDKVKKSIANTKEKTSNLSTSTKQNVIGKIQNSKTWTITKIGQTKAVVDKSKESAATAVASAKSYDWKSLNAKKIIAAIALVFGPILLRFKSWYLTLKPTTVLTITVSTVAFSLTGITVYQQAKEIQDKTAEEVVREPSSISDSMRRDKLARSKYRHHKAKRISLAAVNIPVYIESRKGMQSLKIDFTFEADNRYVAKYFTIIENEYLIRDRLNRTVQPIIPTFPMEAEGKKVLKDKMKVELNKLIKDLKIKGEIKEIYIHSILNG